MEPYIAYWFVVHKGLWNEGWQVQSLTKHDVHVGGIKNFFGPKHCKNGWLYNDKVAPAEAAQIKDLYPRITIKSMAQNGPLMNQFATTIIT